MMPALYHGKGSGAYRFIPVGADFLTFTEFGRDIVDYVREAGFEPEVYAGPDNVTGAETVLAGRVPGPEPTSGPRSAIRRTRALIRATARVSPRSNTIAYWRNWTDQPFPKIVCRQTGSPRFTHCCSAVKSGR